ncbi:hypothetical protein LCGC14_1037060 [marine sediment metagenome]|uniref:Uncharacterized protein n=1 Tax=marine sediment metagenome TaxID=412755 RepID=A0A0F9MSX5_9ZZZZ|nr:hypothetical protein [Candidatus Aminicenantes bacterium]
MGYKEDRKVDKYALDDENVVQASLYGKWAEAQADAELESDTLKERVDLVKAELYIEIVQEYIDKDKKKPTETMIDNMILGKEKYKETVTEYLKAKRDAKVLKGAVKSMSHKKSSLENLTHLWLGSYYAEPKIPAEAKKNSFEKNDEDIKRSRKDRPDRLKRRKIEK